MGLIGADDAAEAGRGQFHQKQGQGDAQREFEGLEQLPLAP